MRVGSLVRECRYGMFRRMCVTTIHWMPTCVFASHGSHTKDVTSVKMSIENVMYVPRIYPFLPRMYLHSFMRTFIRNELRPTPVGHEGSSSLK